MTKQMKVETANDLSHEDFLDIHLLLTLPNLYVLINLYIKQE